MGETGQGGLSRLRTESARGNKQPGALLWRGSAASRQALSSLPSRCYYLLKIPQALELRGVDDRQG